MLIRPAGDNFDPPVFITEALRRRVPKKTDYLREKQALQELALRMADEPAEVLPRFVDLAMEMTGGIAAGISLYEGAPSPGIFRWRYLRGALARFDGAVTPRNFSPCGITLDSLMPVLTCHSERMYSWISDAGIEVPEVLLVPLYLGSKEPLGTLWIVSDEEEHFDSGHARVMTELAAFVGIALRMLRTEQRLKEALDEQELLTEEMNHRVKNAFALIDSMVRLSQQGAATTEEMAQVLSGRLHALADAHALIRRSRSQTNAAGPASDLAALLQGVIRPYDGDLNGERVSISGPPVGCGAHAVNGIALIFHELATNCVKYGALGSGAGHVDVTWKFDDDKLVVCWKERGGPFAPASPAATGFGSKLMRTTVTRQFNGSLDFDWRPEGLQVAMILSTDRLSA